MVFSPHSFEPVFEDFEPFHDGLIATLAVAVMAGRHNVFPALGASEALGDKVVPGGDRNEAWGKFVGRVSKAGATPEAPAFLLLKGDSPCLSYSGHCLAGRLASNSPYSLTMASSDTYLL